MKERWKAVAFAALVCSCVAIGCAARQTVTGSIGGPVNGVTAMVFTPAPPTSPYVPGQIYSIDLSKMTVGGEPPYSFRACSVSPSWLSLSPAGVLSGTVPSSQSGTFTFSLNFVVSDSDRATDAPGSGACTQTGSTNLTMSVSQAGQGK